MCLPFVLSAVQNLLLTLQTYSLAATSIYTVLQFIALSVLPKESKQKNNAYRLQPVDIEQQIPINYNEIPACSYYTTNTEQAQQESEDFVKENFTMITNIPKMLGIKETAEKFSISQNYARQLALSGTVKAVRVGREKTYFPQKSTFFQFCQSKFSSKYSQKLTFHPFFLCFGTVGISANKYEFSVNFLR